MRGKETQETATVLKSSQKTGVTLVSLGVQRRRPLRERMQVGKEEQKHHDDTIPGLNSRTVQRSRDEIRLIQQKN